MSTSISNNSASSAYNEQEGLGKLEKSPVQVCHKIQQLSSPMIRVSNEQSNTVIKLWKVLLDSSSDGGLVFTRAGEDHILPIQWSMEPTSWTTCTGMLQISKWRKVEVQ